MKSLLGIIGGIVVSLGMFAGGLAVAIVLLTAEPERQPGPSLDVADLWTSQPRRVDTTAQDFERLPALHIPSDTHQSAEAQTAATGNVEAADLAPGPVDAMETSSVQMAAIQDPWQQALSDQLSSAHVDWCASRYRSYRPEDNSYTHYSGAHRPCVSPYLEDLSAELASPALSDPNSDAEFVDDPSLTLLQYASNDEQGGSYIASDHASYCFSRYRSYRPEDNTYQPYGGGPRRQCR